MLEDYFFFLLSERSTFSLSIDQDERLIYFIKKNFDKINLKSGSNIDLRETNGTQKKKCYY